MYLLLIMYKNMLFIETKLKFVVTLEEIIDKLL